MKGSKAELLFAMLLLFVPIFAADLAAQESNGRTIVVSQKASNASDKNPGTEDKPLKSISAAAKIATPGDTVLVHEGVYRERVTPAKSGTDTAPIVYMAAAYEHVVIKGSDIFIPEWKKLGTGIYEGALPASMFTGVNPFTRTISISSGDKSETARPVEPGNELKETLGQVFVNGTPYQQAMSLSTLNNTPGAWLVNHSADKILIHFKNNEIAPTKQLVEISTRDRIFSPYRRGLGNIHVKGFTMEHCANQGPFPQTGALSIRSGHNWVIENNTIRYAKTIGLDIGSEYWDGKKIAAAQPTTEEDQKLIIAKNNLITNNTVTDNGLCGIAGWRHDNTKIIGNTVERNNRLTYPHGKGWEEWAGIKLHGCNALIAGNLVRDNEAHGIWIDNDYKNAHITRNVILNNLQSGVFLELGSGEPACLIDNNIIGFTRSQGGFYNGNGIYAHDASNITIAHNLLIANAGFGVCMRTVSGRKFGGKLTGVFDEKILNNMFIGNNTGAISLPYDSARSGNNISDYNYFDAGWGGEGKAQFYINKFQCPFDWKKVTEDLKSRLEKSKVDKKYWPNLENWERYPVVNLQTWQALMGMDAHSASSSDPEGKINIKLRSRLAELSMQLPEILSKMKCPAVEDADFDFYGNPIPRTGSIPGPFQNLNGETHILPLVNAIKNPHIRLTPAQKETKIQEENIKKNTAGIKEKATGKTYLLKDENNGVWFTAKQNTQKPALNAMVSDLQKAGKAPLNLSANSTKGVSQSPSQMIMFKSPADGWYAYKLAAKLYKRTSSTAGYCRAQMYILDADMKNAKLIEQEFSNTKGGYCAEKYDDIISFASSTPLKKGWWLVFRFQIESPGPAPAGSGNLTVAEFSVTEK